MSEKPQVFLSYAHDGLETVRRGREVNLNELGLIIGVE